MRGENFGAQAEATCYGIAALLAGFADDARARASARMTDALAARIIIERRQAKASIRQQREISDRRRRMLIAAAAGR